VLAAQSLAQALVQGVQELAGRGPIASVSRDCRAFRRSHPGDRWRPSNCRRRGSWASRRTRRPGDDQNALRHRHLLAATLNASMNC